MGGSLHHFKPDQVEQIFRDAVQANDGILILDSLPRPFVLWGVPCVTCFFTLGLLLIEPWRLDRWLLAPLQTPTFMHDGFISVLRCYSREEFQEIIKKVDPEHTYEWKFYDNILETFSLRWVVGYPKKQIKKIE